MSVVLLVMTDGRRDCIARSIPSALEHLCGDIRRLVIFDDSGDADYRAWLHQQFPLFAVWCHETRAGFGGAIRTAWRGLRDMGEDDYVFHLEDDFVLTRPVDLTAMVDVLELNPTLVQLALRRQPWNDDERNAGGIIEQHPDAYTDISFGDGSHQWLEHRQFFTTNPSLYRRSLCSLGWPKGNQSEGRFTHELLEDPYVTFGFWGSRDSGEWVTHIGHERVGTGY